VFHLRQLLALDAPDTDKLTARLNFCVYQIRQFLELVEQYNLELGAEE